MSYHQARIDTLHETRLRAWNEARALLDDVGREHRDMSGEEQATWERLNAHIGELDREIAQLEQRERNEVEAAEIRQAQPGSFDREQDRGYDEGAELRAFLTGDGPSALSIPLGRAAKERQLIREGATGREARALAWDTGSVGSTVPVSMARSLYEYLEAEVAMFRAPTTKIVTTGGENMDFPRVAAHGIATQVSGQGTLLAGTDPGFAKMTLGATKYAQLVIVANEVITDAAVDISGFLGRDLGRAVGRLVDQALVSGANGIMSYTTTCGSVTTGGSLITPTYESLINVQYSLADSYRARNSAGWLMLDSTAGTIRKLRDGGGGTEGTPIWQPSLTADQPDVLLGMPVFTDPNVAAQGSNARILSVQDFNSYYVRQVGDVMIELDRSRYFDTDQTGVRAKMRVDGGLIDTNALVSMVMNV